MNIFKKILIGLSCVLGLLMLVGIVGMLYLRSLFGDQMAAIQSLNKIDNELYEMTYRGDYGLDAYIEQGGVTCDEDLRPFLQNFLSHGLLSVDLSAPELPDFGCSTLCAPLTEGDGYLFGRNFDWAKKGKTLIIRTYPKNGYASISTSCLDFLGLELEIDSMTMMEKMGLIAGIYVALDGINEKGLCVADLFAGDHEKTDQNRGNLSVTTTTAIRLLLDHAATTDEAIDMLSHWDMHSSLDWAHHLAISDATGHSVVVEYIDNAMIVTETPAVTNHYLTPLRPHVGIGPTESRRDTLCARLERLPQMQSEDMKQLLSDVAFDEYTGWSIVFNTKEQTATYYYRTDFDHPLVYKLEK